MEGSLYCNACRGPPSPFGLWRGRPRYEGACLAEAGVASEGWWSQAGSNRRPLACHATALPAELWPLTLHFSMISPEAGNHFAKTVPGPDHARLSAPWATRVAQNPEHSSGAISSLLVAADVADDIGHVLVAFFLVGDEGGIIVIVVFDGLVDLDIVFRFGNDSLDLAGVLLGIGFLERHQLFGLDRLGRYFGSGGGSGGTGARGGVGA